MQIPLLPQGVVQEFGDEGLDAFKLIVDINNMRGERYEDTYGEYLKLFEFIAKTPYTVRISVHHAPWSWAPLLIHMGCKVLDPVIHFQHCGSLKRLLEVHWEGVVAVNHRLDRTEVEVLCGYRPETADALWKCDMQWGPPRMEYPYQQQFIVTNNGSFHRSEVLRFRKYLETYIPTKKNVVLVPCAADKPYPSRMHQAVLSMMPNDFYLMNATGVLGLVPQDLWPIMPYYDSGIPNEWRLMETVAAYFSKHEHHHIIVYCDFYSTAILRGLLLANLYNSGRKGSMTRCFSGELKFVNEVKFYYDYIDLLQQDRLEALAKAFKECA